MEYVSTTALASEMDIKPVDLFEKLKGLGWIEKKNDKWSLTETGKQKGGQTRNNPKFGEFIVWPENISLDEKKPSYTTSKLLNATAIGKEFKVSSQRLNLIFSELGWIEKNISGWSVTSLGRTIGGKEMEHETSGGTFVLWPESILNNFSLKGIFDDSINILSLEGKKQTEQPKVYIQPDEFRTKFPANHRTKDGHYVRSRAEVMIDDALYDYGLAHAYEKRVPVKEDLYTDFYLPHKKVYIEYWGLENDPKYAERKKKKQMLYNKYELQIIELNDEDILNLDDHLPKKLLKFGIKVY